MITLISQFAASDSCSNFLGFPTWYEYIKVPGTCTPQITGLNDVWLIVAAVIEILLRLSAILAVGFIIYGGVQFIISQGEPDKTNQARQTIVNALVGLAISVLAAAVISFIAGRVN